MKLLIIILLLSTITACGNKQYYSTPNYASKEDLSDLSKRVDALETLAEYQQITINALSYDNDVLYELIDNLQTQLNHLENESIVNIETSLSNMENDIHNLQEVTENSIVEIIDPCGDGPGFDEVILKLNNGKYIAYFESGGNRHLSLLPPGNYQTTDNQHCNFHI